MSIALKCLLVVGTAVVCLGCNLGKSQEPNAIDRGTYGLEVTPTSVRSYTGGGGVFVLSMTPSEDFEGRVVLSVIAHPSLSAELFDESLTSDRSGHGGYRSSGHDRDGGDLSDPCDRDPRGGVRYTDP